MSLVVVGRFADETEKHSATARTILFDHDVVLHELDRIGPLLAETRGPIAT
jgi:hypothetical protein